MSLNDELVLSPCLLNGCAEEAQEQADASRLIPAYNANASSPEEVYPLHNIVPESEWTALDSIISSIKAADDHVARLKCLPYTRSSWVGTHLKHAYHGDAKPKSSTLYVSQFSPLTT